MPARLYEPVDPDLSAQEQWPQRLPQPGDTQAEPIDLDTTDDDDNDDEEDVSPELARDRKANDARLKDRFEAIFEKYSRDFTGVGDEIDLETGEIVVDNGHLENMQDEADAGDGDSAPLQFAHAFAENLKQEELSSSYESDAEEDEDEPQDDLDTASDNDDSSGDVNDVLFSAREQSIESDTSPVEPDDESIDPKLLHLASAAQLAPACVDASGQSSTWNQSQSHSRSGTTSHSGTPDLDFMRLPEVQETMLALKSQNDIGGRAMDENAIAALGKSIASQIARFMKVPKSKGKRKKRMDAAWDYPELPEDGRRRVSTPPLPSRPRLPSLKSAISPRQAPTSKKTAKDARTKGKGKERPEPSASIWAPVAHPKIRRPRKKKQAEAPLDNTLDDPEAVTAVDEIQGDQNTVHLKRCSNCDAIATVTWRKAPDGSDMCNGCGMYLYHYGLMKPPRPPTPPPEPQAPKPPTANSSKRVVQPPRESSRHTKFTLEEDALVIKLKEFDNLSWEQIGQHFEGRSSFAAQCRYSKILLDSEKPEAAKARAALVEQGFDFVQLERDKNGGFLKKEDELLLRLCPVPPPNKDVTAPAETEGPIVIEDDETTSETTMGQGPDFSAIAAEHFPELSPQALQDRYIYHLERYVQANDPKAKKKTQPRDGLGWKESYSRPPRATGVFFSPEENVRLVQYREVNPISWEAVGHMFPGRSGMSIQKRYTRELAQRKAIVAKGGKDPYSYLFKNGVLSAIDKDAGTQEARKQILKAMERCKFTRSEDERIVRLRQEQKLDWDQMAAQFPERTPDNLQMRYEFLQARLVKPAGSGGLVEDPSIYDIPISDAPQRSEGQVAAEGREAGNAADSGGELPKLKGPRKAKAAKFSKAEDRLILKLYFDQDLDWEQISNHLPGRTAEVIERRFTKKLLPDHGDYEPDDSSDPENSDEEHAANHGDTETGDGEAVEDRQPEYLWEQHAGALPDAEFPGLEDLSDGELGPSSIFLTGSLKQHLQRSKHGLHNHQRYSKRDEDKILQLRREGLNWEAIMSEFPGRTAYELASYWNQRLKPGRTGKGQRTSITNGSGQNIKADSTDGFVGGGKASNLFTLLARGGTALHVADEVPITSAVAKAKKLQDKAFEAANAKRKGTKKKLLRRTKLLPRSLPEVQWLNENGEETVIPSIEPGECLEKLRDGTLVQRFADQTPEIHGWDDSDCESGQDSPAATERPISPAEYDETGFALVDDSSYEEVETVEPRLRSNAPTMAARNHSVARQMVKNESENETDDTDEWRPARRPGRSFGTAKRGRNSTAASSKKRKSNKRQSKRPSKRSRIVRDTETPESLVEIKDESEDEQVNIEPEQDESYERAPSLAQDHPQTPPVDLYDQDVRNQEPGQERAQPVYPDRTPELSSPALHPTYDTPARYEQQAHPYYAAPAARMYSPLREERPTEHDSWADSMDIDPALLPDATGGPHPTSKQPDISASSAPISGTSDVFDTLDPEFDDENAMSLDSDDHDIAQTRRQRASGEPLTRTRRSMRRGAASTSPPPDLLSSANNPPPFSWSELVTMALKSIASQRLSTNGIYLFLQDKFPYFKTCNAEWKKVLQTFLARSSDFARCAEKRGEDSWTFASRLVKVPERKERMPERYKEAAPDTLGTESMEDESLSVEPGPMAMQTSDHTAPANNAHPDESTETAAFLDGSETVNDFGDIQAAMVSDRSPTASHGHVALATSKEATRPSKRAVPSLTREEDTGRLLDVKETGIRSGISLMPERKRRGRPRGLGPRPLERRLMSKGRDGVPDVSDPLELRAAHAVDSAFPEPPQSDPAFEPQEDVEESSSAHSTLEPNECHGPDAPETSTDQSLTFSYRTYDKDYVIAHPEFEWVHRGHGRYRRKVLGHHEVDGLNSSETDAQKYPTKDAACATIDILSRSTQPDWDLLDGANANGTFGKDYVEDHPEPAWIHRGNGRYRRKSTAELEETTTTHYSPSRAPAAASGHARDHRTSAMTANMPSLHQAEDVPILVRSSAFGRTLTSQQQNIVTSDICREPDSSSSSESMVMSAAKQATWPLTAITSQTAVHTPVPSSPAPRTIFERLAGYVNRSTSTPQNAGSALFSRHLHGPQQRAASQAPVQYSRLHRAMTPGMGPSQRAATPAMRASSVGLGSVAARRALAREGTPFSKRVVETPPPSRDAGSEEDELA
ncbi:Centromere protein Scm3 [Teratosphaeria destructans]|uniref:Centromere protein Scm3 n=1 Tax=Teratosphaeria destructans TaxID=418781 RepID=A0A9W7SYF2_9PEZI|nr:Centromere protein Scm3 [Teratosphaeria destructans]